ncbi:hypothetical protein Nepgr_027830 [Nepenthes gracilis]|uniref:Uncharacterized protein n=1 Tax=Nepenthes gracilis TaxID=150966 RepID=A0AAD3TAT1_NEPGR|nr:hypothetical protein Nepgr_027830 [Nepenthes gracilis]
MVFTFLATRHLVHCAPHGLRVKFKDPVVAIVVVKLGKTLAQVDLRWDLQMGHSVLPKSTNETRIKGNLDVVDCVTSMLCKQQLQELTKCASNKVVGSSAMAFSKLSAQQINGQQLQHYPTFGRNGTTIAIPPFVFFLAIERSEYIAYLKDMYEGQRGLATTQDICAECIDDPAIVLSCEHFEKCMADVVRGNERIRNFGERQCFLKGPFGAEHRKKIVYEPLCRDIKYYMPSRRLFTFKNVEFNKCWDGLVLKIDEKIELLSQDNDVQGYGFRITILEIFQKQVKVQYDDLEDQEGCGNLEEWVPNFGVRCPGRPTIWSCPPYTNAAGSSHEVGALLSTWWSDFVDFSHEVGAPLSTWWSDGWWNDILARVSNGVIDSMQVYIPSKESPIKWLGDTSYLHTTLSWNIISGSSMIEQETKKPATYFITVGNLNSEAVKVQLNFNMKAVLCNTTPTYFKCSLCEHICSFNLLLLKENAIVLTSLDSGQAKAEDDWLQARQGGDGAGETGQEAHDPLLSPKDNDLSTWRSSDIFVSQEEDRDELARREKLFCCLHGEPVGDKVTSNTAR